MTLARRAAALVAAVFLVLPTSARTEDAPLDAAAIRERVRAATGQLPAQWRQTTVTTSSNATTTTVTRRQRDTSYRELIDTPPFHSERGSENGRAWHQNDNGQTVLDHGALAERFILDTGGVGTFLVFYFFARRHPEASRTVGRKAMGIRE